MLTFVRDPVELLVSQFNYAVDVVRRSANVHAANPAPFLKRGLDPGSFSNTYRRGFFIKNVQCSFLSGDATCASALRSLAGCNAELRPSSTVNELVANLFPGVGETKVNVSTQHVRAVEIDHRLREEIIVRNHHDRLLYEVAESRHAERTSGR